MMARSSMAQVERLLTVAEVAALLGRTERFPRRLIAERRIRFVRVGRHVRIPQSAVGEFIAAGLVEPITDGRGRRSGLMSGKRRFGRVRELPSDRWQARYKGPDGIDRPTPHTFARKADAEKWLVKIEAEIDDDLWLNPDVGRVAFGDFARAWIDERSNLRPHTVAVYRYMLERHLVPSFGKLAVADIREAHVRRWRKKMLDARASAASTAKAYRLFKAVLNTAADDGLIRRNPCRIKGAGLDKSPERSVLTLRQVGALADAIRPRYRALILAAVFGSLRWGELAALRRSDIDLRARTIRVQRSLTELPGGGYAYGPPKSEAGKRLVVFPAHIAADLKSHLADFVAPEAEALVFTSPTGAPLRSNFRRRVWVSALARAGIPELHFHALRHTGNQLTAAAGATLREMMDRMGHSSTRAALIYMHGSDARQREIADIVSKLAQTELRQSRRRTKKRPHSEVIGHTTGTPEAGHCVMTRISRDDTQAELGEYLCGPRWT